MKLNRVNNVFIIFGIYFVVFLECYSLLPLFFDVFTSVYVILISLLIIGFGYIAHIHFSIIMLGCLLSFSNEIAFHLNTQIWAIIVIISLILFRALGNYYNYLLPVLAKFNFLVFSVLSTFLLYVVLENIYNFKKDFSGILLVKPTSIPLIFLYVLNSLGPYLGVKYEFSFAMFSNLKYNCQNHFIIKRPLLKMKVRYFEIKKIKGVPDSILVNFLKDYKVCHYNIGYLMDVCNIIVKSEDFKNFKIIGAYTDSNELVTIDRYSLLKLSLTEKLGIFPFQISKSDLYTIPA
ncbi:hypothetical protein [Flavivirga rizhaonensis]|uniref:Uncharacterized protein n=1 Tax=Flavivirga rizhaonensis TaxID=2559571 RepID=A0A4S1DU72_9FLAO|nr:hypothetical protein [Flavivirga rizhaonensis]TGV01557.1 hypothetical protein EM932_14850 [Flavivirga rizhaonensis]